MAHQLRCSAAIGHGVVAEGDTLRVPAVILRAGLAVKGLRFGRLELSRSADGWVGTPVHVGSHADKVQVGTISRSTMLGGDLSVELQVSEPALEGAGHRITDLREVSLEAEAEAVSHTTDGIINARIVKPRGLVLLVGEAGACSVADGCGLRLSATGACCADCAERATHRHDGGLILTTEAKKSAKEAPAPASSLVDQLQGMTWEGLTAIALSAGIKPPDQDAPTPEQIDEWRDKATRFDKLDNDRKEDLIGQLVEAGHYEEGARDGLRQLATDELAERARLAGVGKAEPIAVAASRGPIHGTDRVVPSQAAAAVKPRDTWAEIRQRVNARYTAQPAVAGGRS